MQSEHKLSDAKRLLFNRYLHGQIPAATSIQTRGSGNSAPLSPVQEPLYRREMEFQGHPALYNECITIRMQGPLDPEILERSFNEIIGRHEAWRTTFETRTGKPVQVIHPPTAIRFSKRDLRELPDGEREAEASRLAVEDIRRPFQLGAGPLLRPTLIRIGEDEYRLILVAHQIVLDGRSAYQIYPFELATLYKSFLSGQPARMPELPVQYADFACWQRETLKEQESKNIEYWRNQLEGKAAISGWPISDNAKRQLYAGRVWPFSLSSQLSAQIRAVSRKWNTSLFVVLLTGAAALLQNETHGDEVVLGTLSPSGRKKTEVMDLIGYFLNPVTLRIPRNVHSSSRELSCHIACLLSEAMSNDDVPIEGVARALDYPDTDTPHPFFNVVVSLQPPTPDLKMPWSVTSMDADSGGSPWPLYIAFIDLPEAIIGRVQWNPTLIETKTIETLLQELQGTLEAICRC